MKNKTAVAKEMIEFFQTHKDPFASQMVSAPVVKRPDKVTVAGAPLGVGGGGSTTVVNQHNDTKIEIHDVDPNKAESVANVTAARITDVNKRNNAKAHTNVKRP